ncbi:hypothetical protein J6590_045256 [Homalodisca vitripennis]|nr:hypothetical protein J6590_045256 [Homalodisca vitripennis]
MNGSELPQSDVRLGLELMNSVHRKSFVFVVHDALLLTADLHCCWALLGFDKPQWRLHFRRVGRVHVTARARTIPDYDPTPNPSSLVEATVVTVRIAITGQSIVRFVGERSEQRLPYTLSHFLFL